MLPYSKGTPAFLASYFTCPFSVRFFSLSSEHWSSSFFICFSNFSILSSSSPTLGSSSLSSFVFMISSWCFCDRSMKLRLSCRICFSWLWMRSSLLFISSFMKCISSLVAGASIKLAGSAAPFEAPLESLLGRAPSVLEFAYSRCLSSVSLNCL